MNGTAKTANSKIKLYATQKGIEAGYENANTIFEWDVKNGTWLHRVKDNLWINCGVTSNLATILTNPTTTPVDPPVPTGKKLKNIIDVYDDGSLVVKPQ